VFHREIKRWVVRISQRQGPGIPMLNTRREERKYESYAYAICGSSASAGSPADSLWLLSINGQTCHCCDRSGACASPEDICSCSCSYPYPLFLSLASLPFPFYPIHRHLRFENVHHVRRRDRRDYKQVTRCLHCGRLERCANRPSADLRVRKSE
jgi:hypothetical protein